jgi:predicted secreted Zn-dependent protease
MADAIRPELLPNGLPVMQPAVKAASEQPVTANTNENYMSVWEAVRSSSEKSIRKALGKEEEVLAYADEPQDSKIRLVDVVSKGMEKLSNEKVQMNAGYDNEKQSNTFSFSVGKFKIEKK